MAERGQRRVVCAANFCPDLDIMVLGPRHWDPTMHKQAKRLQKLMFGTEGRDIYDREWNQGFIDQWGVWMDREEAYQVAEAAGQIILSIGYVGTTLYSEHLY